MTIALDPSTPSDFTLPGDTSGLVFSVRRLTDREFSRHVVPGMDGENGRYVLGEAGIEIVRCGLAGWRGLKDSKGNEVAFADEPGSPRRVASEASVDRLPFSVRMELIGEILRLSRISEVERRD